MKNIKMLIALLAMLLMTACADVPELDTPSDEGTLQSSEQALTFVLNQQLNGLGLNPAAQTVAHVGDRAVFSSNFESPVSPSWGIPGNWASLFSPDTVHSVFSPCADQTTPWRNNFITLSGNYINVIASPLPGAAVVTSQVCLYAEQVGGTNGRTTLGCKTFASSQGAFNTQFNATNTPNIQFAGHIPGGSARVRLVAEVVYSTSPAPGAPQGAVLNATVASPTVNVNYTKICATTP